MGGSGNKSPIANYNALYNDFLRDKTKLNRANAEKALNKVYRYESGTMSEREFVEKNIKKEFDSSADVKTELAKLRYDRKPAQFDYLKKHEGFSESQRRDFINGNSDNAVAKYFLTGSKTGLPEKYLKKREYSVKVADGASVPLSKTAYDYAQFIRKKVKK